MTSLFPAMSSTIDLHCGSGLQRSGGPAFAWDVDPSVIDDLFESGRPADSDALPLDLWQEEGRLEVVKTGRHRTVYRLELSGDRPDNVLYIKRYRAADWKARWRRHIRGATARREHRSMVAVAGLGIPTAKVVAVGGPLWPGHNQDSWLVTVGVPDAKPLDELLADADSGLDPIERRLVVGQVAEIIARLHDAGLWHRDLHSGNFLVQQSAGRLPRPVLIDLYPVVGRRPTVARRLDGLARLAAALGSSVTPSERWLFLERYLEVCEPVEANVARRRDWASRASGSPTS